MLFGRRFPTYGGLYGRFHGLALHETENGTHLILEADFQIKNVLETVVLYMLEYGFQIKICFGTQ